jgi:heme exporter protein B
VTAAAHYGRRAWIVLWKDVLGERRSKERLNALVFFALLLLFLFQFTLGDDRQKLSAALPGLLWLGFLLSGLLALGRTFLSERDNDCWEGLVLAPGDKSAVYVGKVAGNLVLMLVVEVIILLLFTVFFDADVARHAVPLSAVLLLGTTGFAAVGTLFAGMTANVRAREILFPVLLLPVLVPVLLGAVKATESVLAGQGLGAVAHWLQLLAAADVVYLTAGILTFDAVLEG